MKKVAILCICCPISTYILSIYLRYDNLTRQRVITFICINEKKKKKKKNDAVGTIQIFNRIDKTVFIYCNKRDKEIPLMLTN